VPPLIYLIATPIGNLFDITLRALEVLRKVDLVLCEDTRRTGVLLQAHGIKKPLKSFHKFNEKRLEQQILQELREGKKIALLTDAGTPSISDPGYELVQGCIKENIPYTILPGPCAPIAALILSGLNPSRFQFLGFVPKKASERKKALIESFYYPGVTLFFESPMRIKKTLEEIAKLAPKQEIAIVREMTKIYEECVRGTAQNLLESELRGEIVLLIEGNTPIPYDMSPEEHVALCQEKFQLTKQEAIKLVAQLRAVPKREIYY